MSTVPDLDRRVALADHPELTEVTVWDINTTALKIGLRVEGPLS